MKRTLLNQFKNHRASKKLLSFLLMTLLFVAGLQKASAQVSSYVYTGTQNPSLYTPLIGLGNPVGTSSVSFSTTTADDEVLNFPIGFDFIFNGTTYTTTNISTNGFITFGATAPLIGEYFPISGTSGYNGAIAAYGRNLRNNSLATLYLLSGTAPNQVLTIQFNSTRAADGGNVQAQIKLYQTTNVIEIIHRARSFSPSPGDYPTSNGLLGAGIKGEIGLRGSNNTDVNNLAITSGGSTQNNWTPLTIFQGTTVANASCKTRGGAFSCLPATDIKFTWTPVTCFAPSAVVAPILTTLQTTATINWTPPGTLPGVGYQVFYATSPTLPNALTVPNGGSTAFSTNTLTLTGLTPNTPYYVYVRSDCGSGDRSGWSAQATFTTRCNGRAVPYSENFDLTTIPNIPACTSNVQPAFTAGEGVIPNYYKTWVTAAPSSPDFGFNTTHMSCFSSPSNNSDSYFYTAGINMIGGTSYKLSYKYGASLQNAGAKSQNLRVYYSTSPVSSSIVSQLASHLSLNRSPLTNAVNFTPPSTGIYYIVFYDTTLIANERTMLDDILVDVSTCFPPTALVASNVSASAETLSWTAPATAPASGYEYYISTSNTPPTFATIISGISFASFTTVNGLLPATTYYYWVRSSCGSDDKSQWSSTFGTFTTNVAPTLLGYCGGVPPASSVNTNYFTEVATSNNTVNISNLSNGYSTPTGYGDFRSQITTNVQGGTCNWSFTGNFTGGCSISIWVDWNQNGIFDAAEAMFATPLTPQINGTNTTVNGSFVVPLTATLGYTTMRFMADFGVGTMNPCVISDITKRGETEDYTFNVILAPPAITLSGATTTICAGDNTAAISMTSVAANYTDYSWTPSLGVTPATGLGPYVFNPSSTTTYILTGFNRTTFKTTTVKYVVNVNALPTPIVLTPATATICQGQAPVSIVASGAIVSGIVAGGTIIYSEEFESAAPTGWTVANNNQTGNVALVNWHQERSPYRYTIYDPISSNDETRFFITVADAGGRGNRNRTILTSPPIAIPTTFSNCNMSYYQFLRGFTPADFSARVEIEVNGSGTWTSINTQTTAGRDAYGTAANFQNVLLDLSAYIGQTIRIRFNHNDIWGFFWAIDNLVVTGNLPNIKWNTQAPITSSGPVPGLFTDVAGTVPYVVGTSAATIYAAPNSTTIYTATATAGTCPTQTLFTVNASSLGAATFTAGTGQFYCGDATPTDITIAGNNGTIVKWQSSSTAAFTTFTDIATTASTLTSANMGLIIATTYYRAVVLVGTCTLNTPPVAVTISTTTWNGSAWSPIVPDLSTKAIFNGNYTSAGDLEACSVLVLSGNVNFLGGATLIVENEVRVSGGTLTFQDTANLVQNIDTSINVGDITYKRTSKGMRTLDYTYWSTPVFKLTNTLGLFSPNTLFDKYFFWDTTLPTWYWSSTPPSTIMQKGTGYIIRAPQGTPLTPTEYPGSFTGVPNNGIITTPISKNGPGNNELNLVGNPYPSDLYADAFIGLNTSYPNFGKIDGTLYFWTHNTLLTANIYTPTDYATYNLSGGVGTGPAPTGTTGGANNTTPNGYIASGQSFFITSLVPSADLTFNNSMRQPGNTSLFFRGAANNNAAPITLEKHRFWLDMTNNNGAFSQSLVAYVEGATPAKDRNFDGLLFDESATVHLYSILNTDKLTIKGVGLPFNEQDTHQLGYISKVAETFQIKLSNFDGLFTTQDVYLEDKELNIFTNLKLADYSFATQIGTFNNRFVIHFVAPTLAVNNNTFTESNLSIVKKQNDIVLKSYQSTMKSIAIYDISGRLIYDNKIVNNNNYTISNLNSSQQVILVKVTTTTGAVLTEKIVF